MLTSFVSWLRRPNRSPVDVVDDPDGTMRLVRVRGTVTAAALLDLFDAGTASGSPPRVHVDLVDARIPAVEVMRELGRTVDLVERHGVIVTVTGVDPHHPALGR